jgi:hypothetical protein
MKADGVASVEITNSGDGPTTRAVLHSFCHVLYTLFNWACMIVYVYQIYYWMRQGAWTKIPSRLLIPHATELQPSVHSGAVAKALQWVLNVELAYTLCAVALILFCVRWLANRTVKER